MQSPDNSEQSDHAEGQAEEEDETRQLDRFKELVDHPLMERAVQCFRVFPEDEAGHPRAANKGVDFSNAPEVISFTRQENGGKQTTMQMGLRLFAPIRWYLSSLRWEVATDQLPKADQGHLEEDTPQIQEEADEDELRASSTSWHELALDFRLAK